MVKLDEAFTKRGTKRARVSEDKEAPIRNHNDLEEKLKKHGLRQRLFGPFGDRNKVR